MLHISSHKEKANFHEKTQLIPIRLFEIERGEFSDENMIVLAHLTVVTPTYLTFIFKTADYWGMSNLGTLSNDFDIFRLRFGAFSKSPSVAIFPLRRLGVHPCRALVHLPRIVSICIFFRMRIQHVHTYIYIPPTIIIYIPPSQQQTYQQQQ